MTTPQTTITHTLFRLLDANRGLLEARGTSNHLPMALAALYRLGANAEQLETFNARHSAQLPCLEIETAQPVTGWREHLNQPGRFLPVSLYFEQRIAREGAPVVMGEVFTSVPFAPATVAFHAIIRMAHGLDVGHAGEIAAGLAVYVRDYLPVNVPALPPARYANVEEQLASMSAGMHHMNPAGPMIFSKLRAVAADPRFIATLSAAPGSTGLLRELAHAAIAIYAGTQDFTALHLVTSTHALRVICDHLPVPIARSLLPAIWAAFCCAWATFGAPTVPHLAEHYVNELPAWPVLLASARAQDDDHMIKLAYAAWEEDQYHPAPWYQMAVAQMLAAAGKTGIAPASGNRATDFNLRSHFA